MSVEKTQLDFIITKTPLEFFGKENWLGFKLTPHTPMLFINKVTSEGIKTNAGFFNWDRCPKGVIPTIYQRLKLLDMSVDNF